MINTFIVVIFLFYTCSFCYVVISISIILLNVNNYYKILNISEDIYIVKLILNFYLYYFICSFKIDQDLNEFDLIFLFPFCSN